MKKILDHLRKKWLSKLNTKNVRFDIKLTPDHKTWLSHLKDIDRKLGLPTQETVFDENLMLSDLWSGYNEPKSHKIDLYYELTDSPKAHDLGSPPSMFHPMSMVYYNQPKGFKLSVSQSAPSTEKTTKKGGKGETAPKKQQKSEPKQAEAPKSEPPKQEIKAEPEQIIKKQVNVLEDNSQKGEAVEGKSNSGFKLNEKNDSINKADSLRGPAGNSEQSLKMIYSHIEQNFPEQTNFQSVLKPNEAPTNFNMIKKITINRKSN